VLLELCKSISVLKTNCHKKDCKSQFRNHPLCLRGSRLCKIVHLGATAQLRVHNRYGMARLSCYVKEEVYHYSRKIEYFLSKVVIKLGRLKQGEPFIFLSESSNKGAMARDE